MAKVYNADMLKELGMTALLAVSTAGCTPVQGPPSPYNPRPDYTIGCDQQLSFELDPYEHGTVVKFNGNPRFVEIGELDMGEVPADVYAGGHDPQVTIVFDSDHKTEELKVGTGDKVIIDVETRLYSATKIQLVRFCE